MKVTKAPKVFQTITLSFSPKEIPILAEFFESQSKGGGGWHNRYPSPFIGTMAREIYEKDFSNKQGIELGQGNYVITINNDKELTNTLEFLANACENEGVGVAETLFKVLVKLEHSSGIVLEENFDIQDPSVI